jgi:hypothetical protein
MVVRTGRSRAGTLSACLSASLVLLAATTGRAQSPPAQAPPPHASSQPKPVTGFVSSYEILRTVRSAGFNPLSPPLREGTVYVLRATDYRGIPMRVVLDARTGVIRDVNRIVSANSTGYGMTSPEYGPPPYVSGPFAPAPYGSPAYGPPAYETPAYGPPAGYGAPPGAGAADEGAEQPSSGAVAAPPTIRPQVSAHPSPPLPRPRPATIGTRNPKDRHRPDKTGKSAGNATAASALSGSGANVDASGINAGSTPARTPAPGKPPVPPLTY